MKPLPLDPPRPYRLRDAFHRRVWRDPGALIATDLGLFGVALALAGLAYDETAFLVLGATIALIAVPIRVLFTVLANRRRVSLIAAAPAAKATLGRARRVVVVHEFFRGARERTFLIPYRFTPPEGGETRGRLLICGCARDRLPEGSTEWVAFDPRRPRRSVPLRAAVMVAPH